MLVGSDAAPPQGSAPAVQPIGDLQRRLVIAATVDCIRRAQAIVNVRMPEIAVRFDLAGATAGMYAGHGNDHVIRYNPWIFARDFTGHIFGTVPHEVAHYAINLRYPRRRVRPHGREWKGLMHALGADPAVTFDMDMTGIPGRRQRRHAYACSCRRHALSTTRHNRVASGRASYACVSCGEPLQHAG